MRTGLACPSPCRAPVHALLAFALAWALPVAAAPAPPTGLAAEVHGSTVTFYWVAPAGPVTGYILEAGSAPGLSDRAVAPTGFRGTSYVATAVPNGRYYVRVRAVSSDGPGEVSGEVLVLVDGATPPGPCPAAPGTPRLVAGATGASDISLSWAPAASGCAPAGYLLTFGSMPGQHDLATIAVPASRTSLSVTAPARAYFLRVVATSAWGRSAPTVEVTGTIGQAAALAQTPAACFECHAPFTALDGPLPPAAAPRGAPHPAPAASHPR
ncbi:MAG: fibronectin type III domain-containing protein [Vicinamibacterales bacterium]